MMKLLLALVALVFATAFAPAARADDCDRDDGRAEYAKCMAALAAAKKMRAMRQGLGSPGRMPAMAGKRCDPDDDDDDDGCRRRLRMQAPRQAMPPVPPPMARPKAASTKSGAGRATKTAAPTAAPSAPAAIPAKAPVGAGEPSVCTKYLPNLGKSIVVPCE